MVVETKLRIDRFKSCSAGTEMDPPEDVVRHPENRSKMVQNNNPQIQPGALLEVI